MGLVAVRGGERIGLAGGGEAGEGAQRNGSFRRGREGGGVCSGRGENAVLKEGTGGLGELGSGGVGGFGFGALVLAVAAAAGGELALGRGEEGRREKEAGEEEQQHGGHAATGAWGEGRRCCYEVRQVGPRGYAVREYCAWVLLPKTHAQAMAIRAELLSTRDEAEGKTPGNWYLFSPGSTRRRHCKTCVALARGGRACEESAGVDRVRAGDGKFGLDSSGCDAGDEPCDLNRGGRCFVQTDQAEAGSLRATVGPGGDEAQAGGRLGPFATGVGGSGLACAALLFAGRFIGNGGERDSGDEGETGEDESADETARFGTDCPGGVHSATG